MAIATTIIARTVFGNKDAVYGKSVLSGGVSTADVVTGLTRTEMFLVSPQGSTQLGHAVNESFPLASGDITVQMESNDTTFYWMAIGYG